MVGARSAAMAFNRLADARIDAENPRTKARALPAGLVTKSFVIVFTAASATLFVFAAWQLNRLAFILSPLALVVVLGYSLTKRVTSLSHVFLGLSLAIAPVGAAIAVTGRFVPSSIILAAGVLVWTAGFDILYSLQDVEFDRERALFSVSSPSGSSEDSAGSTTSARSQRRLSSSGSIRSSARMTSPASTPPFSPQTASSRSCCSSVARPIFCSCENVSSSRFQVSG
jgi:hypothetical protein